MIKEINKMDFLVSKVVKIEDDIIVGNQQLLMQVNEVIEKQINEHNDNNNQLFNKVETLEDTLKQMKSIVDKVNEEVREFFWQTCWSIIFKSRNTRKRWANEFSKDWI